MFCLRDKDYNFVWPRLTPLSIIYVANNMLATLFLQVIYSLKVGAHQGGGSKWYKMTYCNIVSTPTLNPRYSTWVKYSVDYSLKYFSYFFPWKQGLRFHANCLGMKCQILFFFGKIRKNIANLSSAELAQREVKVKALITTTANKNSANQITWLRLLIQIHVLNGRPGSILFSKAGYIQDQQDQG